jgi:hypothetical protein
LAPQFMVEVLAKELGARMIAVNTIEGAGIFTDGVRPEIEEFNRSIRPMARMDTLKDVADAAELSRKRSLGVRQWPAPSPEWRRPRMMRLTKAPVPSASTNPADSRGAIARCRQAPDRMECRRMLS